MKKQSLLKILVCDDDPADRKLCRTYLQQIDSREIVLIEAGQKDEIQNALDRGRIDLVFMDIQMPYFNSWSSAEIAGISMPIRALMQTPILVYGAAIPNIRHMEMYTGLRRVMIIVVCISL